MPISFFYVQRQTYLFTVNIEIITQESYIHKIKKSGNISFFVVLALYSEKRERKKNSTFMSLWNHGKFCRTEIEEFSSYIVE